MQREFEDRVEIETGPEVAAAVIWLHGLGADGHDFAGLLPMLNLPSQPGIRFVFPHAPVQPISINGGMRMRGWYDIRALPIDVDPDAEGIRASARWISELLDRELERGIESQRLLLAGFSQGGAIALHTGLRYPRRLAGIMALSACLHLSGTTESERSPANQDTPFFISHGSHDDIVPVSLGRQSVALLQGLGYKVAWSEYPMAHSVHPDQIQAIRDWLLEALGVQA